MLVQLVTLAQHVRGPGFDPWPLQALCFAPSLFFWNQLKAHIFLITPVKFYSLNLFCFDKMINNVPSILVDVELFQVSE